MGFNSGFKGLINDHTHMLSYLLTVTEIMLLDCVTNFSWCRVVLVVLIVTHLIEKYLGTGPEVS